MRVQLRGIVFWATTERVAALFQSSFPLLSSKMAYLRAFRVPINCIQKAMFDSGRRGRRFKSCRIDAACSRVSGDRNPYFFPKIWRFSNFSL